MRNARSPGPTPVSVAKERVAFLAAHVDRAVEPGRRGERPVAGERQRRDERELDRRRASRGATGTPANVPRVVILPSSHASAPSSTLPSATSKPRLADMHMIARDFERGGCGEPQRPGPAILERVDDARPRPRGNARGIPRIAEHRRARMRRRRDPRPRKTASPCAARAFLRRSRGRAETFPAARRCRVASSSIWRRR